MSLLPRIFQGFAESAYPGNRIATSPIAEAVRRDLVSSAGRLIADGAPDIADLNEFRLSKLRADSDALVLVRTDALR